MRVATTLGALAAAFELAHATIYLAGDSTMAKNGANDGVTDGTYILPSPSHSIPQSPN
jgi:hypothetical protein